MTKFYDAVYSFERVRGYQFVKLYISMFEKWLESLQWLLAVSKPEVCMRVTSAWGQELSKKTTAVGLFTNSRLLSKFGDAAQSGASLFNSLSLGRFKWNLK